MKNIYRQIIFSIFLSCSSDPKTNDKPSPIEEIEKDAESLPGPEEPIVNEVVPKTKLVPYLFSKDGFPKVKKYFYEKTKAIQKLEFDFNGDGRVDFVQNFQFNPDFKHHLDSLEADLMSESSDLDGDGSLEVTNFYEKKLAQKKSERIRQEISTLGSGTTNIWKFYENNKLIRREVDRNGRGRPDYWEYYSDGRLSRVERDDNGDGILDTNPGFRKVGPEPIPNKLAN